ncbi:MAG: glycosyltransferase [Opitutaceae bacterium]|jgi:glycosyltransferase involved in cell wall biosynthesis
MAEFPSTASLPFVTVAIGTYNRARWLGEALKFLTRQDYPMDRHELIIVDNNSTDDTRSVVESFAGAPKAPKYFFEAKQGSSHARNRALAEAKGEIILFTDDDVLGRETWLSRMIEPFLLPGNESIGVVGGEVSPHFPDGLPKWLEGQFRPFGYRTDMGPLRKHQLPSTANVAIKRAVFDHVGHFRTDLGRLPNRLTAGEDHDLMRRIQAAGYVFWFNPAADLQHVVPGNRLTFKYAMKLSYDASCSRVVERGGFPHYGVWLASRIILYTLFVPISVLIGLACFVLAQPGHGKRWLTRAAKSAGYVTESLMVLRRRLRGQPVES